MWGHSAGTPKPPDTDWAGNTRLDRSNRQQLGSAWCHRKLSSVARVLVMNPPTYSVWQPGPMTCVQLMFLCMMPNRKAAVGTARPGQIWNSSANS